MAKKDYFLVIDTETTIEDHVVDFGALVVDRKGKIYAECAVLVNGIFANEDLFYCKDGGHFARESLKARTEKYYKMLDSGSRMLASVNAINRWLEKVNAKYNPYVTAYNISFDRGKCLNTEIDLSIFDKQFCLWHAAFNKWALTKNYKNFIIQIHAFNPPTKLQNMSFKTNAETMMRFVSNNPELEDEPHTAYEDAKFYEIPILLKLVNSTKKERWLNPDPFNWKAVQVKDHFTSK